MFKDKPVHFHVLKAWFSKKYEDEVKNTMRKNLLNWCNLVSIGKKLMFYVFGVVRIYWYVTKRIMVKNSKLRISKYMQNISRSNGFGKFVLIV